MSISTQDHPPLFMREEPCAVYIHVPFCLRRCGYCDFTLIAGRDELVPQYLQALEIELQNKLGGMNLPLPMETIYLGGGTPTQLDCDSLQKLFSLINKYFKLKPQGEFTIEANPEGLTLEKLQLLKTAGVNRISLGIQSFDNTMLKILERDHTSEDLEILLPLVFANCKNVSLDLIFGIPGMSLELWQSTLQKAMSYQPQHLSTYCLTIEKGTSFWSRRSHGEDMQVSNELEAEMYELTDKLLSEYQFERYEVSSYARPGFRSQHNTIYWQAKPYYAFGPGASSFQQGIRVTNDRSVTRYLKSMLQTGTCIVERDELPLIERQRELLVVGLRQRDGINREEFVYRMGIDPINLISGNQLQQKNWLEVTPQLIQITNEGLLFYDTIAHHLLTQGETFK